LLTRVFSLCIYCRPSVFLDSEKTARIRSKQRSYVTASSQIPPDSMLVWWTCGTALAQPRKERPFSAPAGLRAHHPLARGARPAGPACHAFLCHRVEIRRPGKLNERATQECDATPQFPSIPQENRGTVVTITACSLILPEFMRISEDCGPALGQAPLDKPLLRILAGIELTFI
jgi:hypothetical protein